MSKHSQDNVTMRSRSPKVVITKSEASSPIKIPIADYAQHSRSFDKTWRHQLPVTAESEALSRIMNVWKSNAFGPLEYEEMSAKDFVMANLDDFEIYTSPTHDQGWEITSLEYLGVRSRVLLFDGVLSIGAARCYVQAVPIKRYSIEGYSVGDDPNTTIYIQSEEASSDKQCSAWYRLRKPARSYVRYYDVTQWVTTLAKHLIDFLEAQGEEGLNVGLEAFRKGFHSWLLRRFPHNPDLEKWLQSCGRYDFRQAINAHIDFLRQEAYNLPNWKSLLEHHIWADCMKGDHHSIRKQETICKKTVVTPFVYGCFRDMYFAEEMEEIEPSSATREVQDARKTLLGFPISPENLLCEPTQDHEANFSPLKASIDQAAIKVGDVVAFPPSEAEERLWRKGAQDVAFHEWIAYIQRIEVTDTSADARVFVIWLYRPEDTTICTAKYPIAQELFFSDHCNCNEPKLFASEISRICGIEWFSRGVRTSKDFLVRQKYVTKDNSFISLKEGDFLCDCKRPSRTIPESYCKGDAYYIEQRHGGKKILEPTIIHHVDDLGKKATVRKLLRLKRDCLNIPGADRLVTIADNELVWTSQLMEIPLKRIIRKCYIRYFPKTDTSNDIPFPYNRNGAMDFWVLSCRLTNIESFSIESLESSPPFNQGPHLTANSTEKLPGLSLFSGCGNLDRGLEEAGAVEFKTHIDIYEPAIHSIRANARHPDEPQLWLGSIDDYLSLLLLGHSHEIVARVGDVVMIAAGSPCPGFSALQSNWKSAKACKDASHVTTFCSFVDVYLPKWAILENVVNMGVVRKGSEEQVVLSQIVACLVGLGYQVQQFIMSSWNYGSPQQRSRLIISIAAPDIVPLQPPAHSHNSPDYIACRSVSKLLNGERFGHQEFYPTPFDFVTAGQATVDLPTLGNGNAAVHGCIPYPDHQLTRPLNLKCQKSIACVPTDPPGQGLAEAIEKGLVPKDLYEPRSEIGHAFRRTKKDGLIPTITTQHSAYDARTTGLVHWQENRPLTVEEARRAQGVRPHEVMLGSRTEQIRLLGNAVDRHIAEPVGLSLRRAVEESLRVPKKSTTTPKGNKSHVQVRIPQATKSKRPRERDGYYDQTLPGSVKRLSLYKKARQNEHIRARADVTPRKTPYLDKDRHCAPEDRSIVAEKEIEVRPSPHKKARRNGHAHVHVKVKPHRTRHSGLEALFAPQDWSKVPEKTLNTGGNPDEESELPDETMTYLPSVDT